MRESTRKGEQPMPRSAIVLLAIFLLISLLLILFSVRPVVPVSRGFGVGPTPTLAAPLPPTQ